jgi:hypothetical protein
MFYLTSFHKIITIVSSLHTPCPPPLINFQAIKSIFLFLEGHEEQKSLRFVHCFLAKGVRESILILESNAFKQDVLLPLKIKISSFALMGFKE